MAINKITKSDVQEFAKYGDSEGFNLYQTIATQSAVYPGQGTPFGLLYTALGLGEGGEAQNKIKKAFRDDGCIGAMEIGPRNEYGDRIARVVIKDVPKERVDQITKELGGLLWYIAATCNELRISMFDVALANLMELHGRTERGTLQGSGDDR